jgi:hypothetical protein
VFPEKSYPIARREQDQVSDRAGSAESPAPAASTRLESRAEQSAAEGVVSDSAKEANVDAPRQLGKLGTGHGRNESSHASVVRFERASVSPAELVTIQYDRRENLLALGVIPSPQQQLAHRDPNPFPGTIRFVPDPQP